jgi:hypothetical protein
VELISIKEKKHVLVEFPYPSGEGLCWPVLMTGQMFMLGF